MASKGAWFTVTVITPQDEFEEELKGLDLATSWATRWYHKYNATKVLVRRGSKIFFSKIREEVRTQ